MCGIAGFWQTRRSTEAPAAILARMGAALQHRGPDDSGLCFEAASGIGLAHRRLSILDLSPAGRQPMASASGRYAIVFNGEIYNFAELRRELGPGHQWRGHSDTEVMLAAIEQWGLEPAVRRFAGMFAFALSDRRERKLFLVRDRLGVKPLYYGRVGGDFVFASELKAIRQYPGFDAAIDRDALALYLRHNYVPSPHCIYQGLRKLPPGCSLALAAAEAPAELRRFWSATDVARAGLARPFPGSDQEAVAQLAEQLARAVSRRMVADVPLGAFLSGGIDSSTVVALMQAQSPRPVKTFTIGFHEDDYDEAGHARRIAAHLGTDHTELYVSARAAQEVVPQLPAMFDEPFADSSQIPTFLISKLARQSVTVSLSGDGGDELFGGYNRYRLTRRIWNGLRRVPQPLRRLAAQLILQLSPQRIDDLYRLVRPLIPPRRRSAAVGDKAHRFAGLLELQGLGPIHMQALSHWEQPAEVVLGGREPATVTDFIAQALALPTVEEAMMLTDLAHYLPDDILTKIDRASMAVSLEARVPLLDHQLVEFAWTLPLACKIRDGVGKWILRQVLYQHVPRKLMERPKMGFGVPIGSWLRGPLRAWAEDLLSPEALKLHGFFEIGTVRRRWQEHLSGARNWQYELWDVLIFEDWLSHQGQRPEPEPQLTVEPAEEEAHHNSRAATRH